MVGEADTKDKNESRKIAIVLISLVVLVGLALFLMAPTVAEFVAVYLSPGLGLKQAAVIAFFITIVTLLIFTLAAGEGLLGELQFILVGFFLFFLILWLMIAWIF